MKLACRVFGHKWKNHLTGHDLSRASWNASLNSYVVCARCGIAYSVWLKEGR